jgi:hypothetical protein
MHWGKVRGNAHEGQQADRTVICGEIDESKESSRPTTNSQSLLY